MCLAFRSANRGLANSPANSSSASRWRWPRRRQRGHDVHTELALYVIHGLLHLCGYDDHAEADAQAMRERERHYLRLLGLPDIAPRDEE